jgi:MFS family permease
METQENTSISEPAKEQSVSRLPVLTKVAAWWILVVGIVGVIGAIVFPIVLSTMGYSDEQEWGQVVGIVAMIFWMGVCPVFILVAVAGGVLFTRSRWALIFSIAIISIVVFGSTIGGVFILYRAPVHPCSPSYSTAHYAYS